MLTRELTPTYNNTAIASATAFLISIDAASRPYIALCDCEDDEDIEPNPEWAVQLRLSGVLSIIGSLYILISLAGTKSRRATNLQLLFNRLLLGVSLSTLLSSIGFAVGPAAFGSSPPGDFERFYSQGSCDLV